MKRTIALSLCLAFVASVAFAFPFGMPPQENPLVTKVAPEESGMFLSWQGNDVADANSNNLVEQSLTKPEIQAKLKEMRESVLENLSDRPLFADFAKLAMRNGASFYVSDLKSTSFAGMIALGEKDLNAVDKLTAETKRLSNAGADVSTITIGKLSFFKLSGSGEKDFYWGAFGKGKVVVFANSQKAITTILKNARTPEPDWVANAKKEFNIERLSSMSAMFGDIIEESAKQNEESSDVDPATADLQKKLLGSEYVDRVVAASGLDSVGAVHKTATYMKDGWKKSLPGILIDKPLSEKDLSVIPSNAVFAFAGKTDLNGLLNAVSESDAIPDDMKMQMTMATMVAKPYLASMGDSWAFFMTEDDGVPGGALVWSLKNSAMAKIQLKQLMEMLKKNFQRTEMEFDSMGLNNRELRVIPTQLKLFGDDDEEDEDDNNNNFGPNAQVEIQGQVIIPGGIPQGGIPMQVVPGGQLPNGAVPLQVMPGGQMPPGAVPMGRGQVQLGGNVDPSMLLNSLPESIEKIKIDGNDFWLLKRGEDNDNNLVIGIAGKNLIVTTKSYAEKYVKFDGTKNLSSNKSVARMMANNPSYLIYANQDSVPSILKGLVEGMVPSGAEQFNSILDVVTETKLPVVAGIYSKGDSIRIDVISGLPIPDWMTFSFLCGLSSAVTSAGN